MKTRSRDNKSKQTSPSKRNWFSNASKLLKQIRSRKFPKIDLQSFDEKTRAEFCIQNSSQILQYANGLPSIKDIEECLEEVDYLGIPQNANELNKLNEIQIEVQEMQRNIDKLVNSNESIDLNDILWNILQIVGIGVSFESAKKLISISELNLNIQENLSKSMSIDQIDLLLKQCKSEGYIEPSSIESLKALRKSYIKIQENIEEINSSPSISLIDELLITNTLKQIMDINVDIADTCSIKSIMEMIEIIKSLSRNINSILGNMEVEKEKFEISILDVMMELSSNINSSIDFNVLNDKNKETIKDLLRNLKQNMKNIRIEDTELITIITKLDSIVWRYEAQKILESNTEEASLLICILDDIPQDLINQGCNEYSKLKERVHAINTAIQNENRIINTLDNFWNDQNLHLNIDKLQNFVEEAKTFILKNNIEKQIEIILEIAMAIKNTSNYSNLEELVDDMRDLDLVNTKTFNKLSTLSKLSAKSKKHRGWLNINRKKLNRFRKENQPSLSSCFSMPRIDLNQAKEIFISLQRLPSGLIEEYEEDIKILGDELDINNKLDKQINELDKKYTNNSFLKLEINNNDLIEVSNLLKKEIQCYFNVNYSSKDVEQIFSSISLLIKATLLVSNNKDNEVKRDLSSWESTFKSLKEKVTSKKKPPLLNEMNKRLKAAEKLIMEVFKMKQYQNQFCQASTKSTTSQMAGKQAKLPSISEAKVILTKFETCCKEIKLDETTLKLEEFISKAEKRIELTEKDTLTLKEVTNLLDNIRRTPLNLQDSSIILSLRIKNATDFVKKLRITPKEKICEVFDELSTEYINLNTIIPEFDKLRLQVIQEKKTCEKIEKKFEELQLFEIIELRRELQSHLYFKNRLLELKILQKQVDLLEVEYTKAQICGDEKPMFDLVSLTALQREIIESKKTRFLNEEAPDMKNRGNFLIKLISDVKEYLKRKIFTLDLKGIDDLENNYYMNFIDLTKEITDHKIKLQINLKCNENPGERVVKSNTKKYDGFGLFGNEIAFISQLPENDDKNSKDGTIIEQKTKVLETSEPFTSHQDHINLPSKFKPDKSRVQRRKRFELPYFELKKPAIIGTGVNKQLRQYYKNYIKFWLEKNDSFDISGLDALMAATNLEKQVFEKYMDRLSDYDNICDQISRIFKMLISMKYLSKHLSNKGFSMETILKLTNKDKASIRRIDLMAKAKIQKQRRANSNQNQISPSGRVYQPQEIKSSESDLKFSDIEDEEIEEQTNEPHNKLNFDEKISHNHEARIISYDPDSRKYEVSKNKFLKKGKKHNFFSIFKGNIFVEKKERSQSKKIDNISINTCSSCEDFVRYFSEIPEGLTLTCQLQVVEFEQYIQKVLMSNHAPNYLILPFWIDCETPLATKKYFKSQGCVASMQYSKRCKLFVFPKEFLKEEWLRTLNFYIIRRESTPVELVGFLVLKLVESSGYEVSITPEQLEVDRSSQNGHKVYKLVKDKNCIFDHQVDLKVVEIISKEQLKLQNSNQKQNRKRKNMFNDLVKTQKSPKNHKKHQVSRLSRLMGGNQNAPPSVYKSPSAQKFGSQNSSEVFFNESTQSGSNYQSDLLNALKVPGQNPSASISPSNNLFQMKKNYKRKTYGHQRRKKDSSIYGSTRPHQRNSNLLNILDSSPNNDDGLRLANFGDQDDQLSQISSIDQQEIVSKNPDPNSLFLGKRVEQSIIDPANLLLGKPINRFLNDKNDSSRKQYNPNISEVYPINKQSNRVTDPSKFSKDTHKNFNLQHRNQIIQNRQKMFQRKNHEINYLPEGSIPQNTQAINQDRNLLYKDNQNDFGYNIDSNIGQVRQNMMSSQRDMSHQ